MSTTANCVVIGKLCFDGIQNVIF